MKHHYLMTITFLSLFFFSNDLYAQRYRWLKGGGSTDNLMNGGIQHEPVKYMCTDDNKNVYLLAQVGKNNIKADTFSQSASTPTVGWNIILSSYDCDGKMRFAKLLESNSNNRAFGLEYNNGKLYVCGTLFNTGKKIGYDATFSTVNTSSFLAKFDTSGQYHWTRFIGPDNSATQVGTGRNGALAIDGQGNIHHFSYLWAGVEVTPSITTSQTGNYDIRYDVNGNVLGVNLLQFPDTNYRIKLVEIDKISNKPYVLFESNTFTPGLSGQFLISYSPTGSLIWIDSSFSVGGGGIANIKVSNDGLYAFAKGNGTTTFSLGGMSVNNTHHTTGAFSIFTKLDFNGNAKWMYHVDGTTGVQGLYGELLPNNQLAGFGIYNGKAYFGNDSISSLPGGTVYSYVVILDTAGNLVKLQAIPSATDVIATAVTSDKAGNFYMGGWVGSTITPPGLSAYTSNGGNSDFFVIKYGYPCNCSGPPTSNFTYVINTNSDTAKFTYSGTSTADSVVWDFGDGSPKVKQNTRTHIYAANGLYTVCATVYTPCGMHKQCKQVQVTVGVAGIEALAGITVYPNPVNDVLHVKGLTTASPYRLYNTVGTVVLSGSISSDAHISTQSLAPGMYMLELNINGQRGVVRLVKH